MGNPAALVFVFVWAGRRAGMEINMDVKEIPHDWVVVWRGEF
jgi:hypothetical protein